MERLNSPPLVGLVERVPGSGDKPVTRNFRWPTPPYALFPADIEQTEAQDCEITAIGGRRVAGKMTFFLPEQDALEFQLPRATTTQTIYLGEILTLRLTRPVSVTRENRLKGIANSLRSGTPSSSASRPNISVEKKQSITGSPLH